MTKAKQFLIKQHKTGRYDAITSNPNPDYNAPFFNSIAVLLEEYGKQARVGVLTEIVEMKTISASQKVLIVNHFKKLDGVQL